MSNKIVFTCYKCDEMFPLNREVMLELDHRDNRFYDPDDGHTIPEEHSQGGFSFCEECSKNPDSDKFLVTVSLTYESSQWIEARDEVEARQCALNKAYWQWPQGINKFDYPTDDSIVSIKKEGEDES